MTPIEVMDLIPHHHIRPSVHNAFYYLIIVEDLKGLWYILQQRENMEPDNDSQQPQPCEVLFSCNLLTDQAFGVQKKIAARLSTMGLTTGVIGAEKNYNGFDQSYRMHPAYPVSSGVKQQIIDQCKYVFELLKDVPLNNMQKKTGLAFTIRFALLIEAYINQITNLLTSIKPKIVLLITTSFFTDVAIQIACRQVGIPSIFYPHGFPARLIAPIRSSMVATYAPHQDGYFHQLSNEDTRIIPAGWLEPQVTIGDQLDKLLNVKTAVNKRYQVLLFSQYSAARLVSLSLITLLSQVINTLNNIKMIDKVILRLHPPETPDSKQLTTLLKNADPSKLHISYKEPLIENLAETNYILGFCSTALLYGPYLNRRVLEIRDTSINKVFGQYVLPERSVYDFGEHLNASELKERIIQAKPLYGQDFFHNWRRELDYMATYIENLTKNSFS